ncbi:NB-ARC-like protein [Artemisia annua]|uniref:NB-ARC-like protein n=1 Tax=Artemisia annua TaxID=35608 RepID=A0A2U1N8X0_ARTAN|nr:NB-ARC-like protein [Artemisia annua]
MDDVLDDMAFEALRRELNQEPQTSSSSTSKLLNIIPTYYTPHNIMYGRKISSKLDEITSKLHDLVEEKNNLGLDVNVLKGQIDDWRKLRWLMSPKFWVGKGIKRHY